jgi:uncharacterized protein (DUF736 family)
MKLNFSLFKNTYKEAGSNQPDYTCSVFDKESGKSTKIGGGWVKEGKNGKYISVSIDDEYKPEGTTKKADPLKYPEEEITEVDVPF